MYRIDDKIPSLQAAQEATAKWKGAAVGLERDKA
jgi:hypothetical protein